MQAGNASMPIYLNPSAGLDAILLAVVGRSEIGTPFLRVLSELLSDRAPFKEHSIPNPHHRCLFRHPFGI